MNCEVKTETKRLPQINEWIMKKYTRETGPVGVYIRHLIAPSLLCILPLYGQVAIFMDVSLICLVQVFFQRSPYFLLLSSITSSTAFSLASLLPSSPAVVLLVLFFSLNSHAAADVLLTFSVNFSVCRGVHFSPQLLLTPLYSYEDM